MHHRFPTTALALGAAGAWLLAMTAPSAFASATASVQGDVLQITGDGAGDTFVLRLQPGSPTTLEVDVGADGTADFSFDRTTFSAIHVDAGGGDDEVTVDQSGGVFNDEQLTVDGGSGA